MDLIRDIPGLPLFTHVAGYWSTPCALDIPVIAFSPKPLFLNILLRCIRIVRCPTTWATADHLAYEVVLMRMAAMTAAATQAIPAAPMG